MFSLSDPNLEKRRTPTFPSARRPQRAEPAQPLRASSQLQVHFQPLSRTPALSRLHIGRGAALPFQQRPSLYKYSIRLVIALQRANRHATKTIFFITWAQATLHRRRMTSFQPKRHQLLHRLHLRNPLPLTPQQQSYRQLFRL